MPLRTPQQGMSELYRPPSSARGDSQKSDASTAREFAADAEPQRRVSRELCYKLPTRTQNKSQQSREWLASKI